MPSAKANYTPIQKSSVNVHMASFLPLGLAFLVGLPYHFFPAWMCSGLIPSPSRWFQRPRKAHGRHSLCSQYFRFSLIWPREVHHNRMTHCGQWNISQNGMCLPDRSISKLNHSFPHSPFSCQGELWSMVNLRKDATKGQSSQEWWTQKTATCWDLKMTIIM